jgi:hypothetical protein
MSAPRRSRILTPPPTLSVVSDLSGDEADKFFIAGRARTNPDEFMLGGGARPDLGFQIQGNLRPPNDLEEEGGLQLDKEEDSPKLDDEEDHKKSATTKPKTILYDHNSDAVLCDLLKKFEEEAQKRQLACFTQNEEHLVVTNNPYREGGLTIEPVAPDPQDPKPKVKISFGSPEEINTTINLLGATLDSPITLNFTVVPGNGDQASALKEKFEAAIEEYKSLPGNEHVTFNVTFNQSGPAPDEKPTPTPDKDPAPPMRVR